MTSPAASGRHLSRLEKRPKMPHPTALLALSIMQCGIKPNAVSKASQIYRVKNIANVSEQSGVAFCLAPPYGGLLGRKLLTTSVLFVVVTLASVSLLRNVEQLSLSFIEETKKGRTCFNVCSSTTPCVNDVAKMREVFHNISRFFLHSVT